MSNRKVVSAKFHDIKLVVNGKAIPDSLPSSTRNIEFSIVEGHTGLEVTLGKSGDLFVVPYSNVQVYTLAKEAPAPTKSK